MTAKPWITISASCLLVLVAVLNVTQTQAHQWTTRPNISCNNGQSTHRFVEVIANRVNIRDLPTVFSNVLGQTNAPEPLTVVCEFGVWSRVVMPELAEETWISSGLIKLTKAQPLTKRMRILIISMFLTGLGGLLIGLYRPQWIIKFQNLLLQTQELPPHARPLISNPLSHNKTQR